MSNTVYLYDLTRRSGTGVKKAEVFTNLSYAEMERRYPQSQIRRLQTWNLDNPSEAVDALSTAIIAGRRLPSSHPSDTPLDSAWCERIAGGARDGANLAMTEVEVAV